MWFLVSIIIILGYCAFLKKLKYAEPQKTTAVNLLHVPTQVLGAILVPVMKDILETVKLVKVIYIFLQRKLLSVNRFACHYQIFTSVLELKREGGSVDRFSRGKFFTFMPHFIHILFLTMTHLEHMSNSLYAFYTRKYHVHSNIFTILHHTFL